MSALLATLGARQARESGPAGGPKWLREKRELAMKELASSGLPTKKTEAWRFTAVRDLVETARLPVAPKEQEGGLVPNDGSTYVIDGSPVSPTAPIHSMLDALAGSLAPLVQEHLGSATCAEFFAGMNLAMFDDGVVVYVPRGTQANVSLMHISAAEAGQASYPRTLVIVEDNAELTLTERYAGRAAGDHLQNAVTEVILLSGARCDHTRVHEDPSHHVGALSVRQHRDSSYVFHGASFAGELTRLDLTVMLEGDGASCVLDGVYHAQGRQVVDHHVRVDHVGSHCSSQQTFRGVVDERGTSIFDGQAIVHRGAKTSEAHQENRNLLLSDTATVHTKPHLEIDDDDVIASHGATVGALSDEQLFYLMSRGVPEASARAILTHAFISSLVEKVPGDAVREAIKDGFFARLPEGDTLRDLEGASFDDGSVEDSSS